MAGALPAVARKERDACEFTCGVVEYKIAPGELDALARKAGL
jgi:hypothetical protein